MDTSDFEIFFDNTGVCCHCYAYEQDMRAFPKTLEEKTQQLNRMVETIKRQGKDKKYDCIIGLSGGIDSSFLAYKVKELGLRPLAVHFDNCWDSELAQKNIENLIKKLNLDLYTFVMDWDEFKDLQLAFLKASTTDGEIPTDHGILAILLRSAIKQGCKYIISGTNHATEGVLPTSYAYGVVDWRYIKHIHKKYGSVALKRYPHFSFFGRLYYIFVKGIKNIGLLNYIDYNKSDAQRILEEKFNWRYYGGKHYESIYTRFYQGYILPNRFGVDKRRAHLSSLILSGQITREQALEEFKKPVYPEDQFKEDFEFVLKKFNLTPQEFEGFLKRPLLHFKDFPTYQPFLRKSRKLVVFAKQTGLLPKKVGV